jgi:TusA-related sulfurtransferase
VQATDPHATIDFEAYCARTGHTISYSKIKDEVISLYIIRAENLNID